MDGIIKERHRRSFGGFTEMVALIWKHLWRSEDSALSGTLTHFQWPNQKALEASCHFSLECFLSKNRKGSSVSHTLTQAPYQCGSDGAKRHNAQSSSCRVIVATRSGSSLCCRVRTRTNGAALERATHRLQHRSAPEVFFPLESSLAPRRLSSHFFSFAMEPAVSRLLLSPTSGWILAAKALSDECYLTSAVKHCLKGKFLSMSRLSNTHTHPQQILMGKTLVDTNFFVCEKKKSCSHVNQPNSSWVSCFT